VKYRVPIVKVAALVAAGLLAGCATDVYEGQYAFRDGWRRGKVVKVVNGANLERPGFWECTRRMTQAERLASDFAVVSYRGVSRQSTYAVPLMAGTRLQPEDKVYINLNTCHSPVRAAPAG